MSKSDKDKRKPSTPVCTGDLTSTFVMAVLGNNPDLIPDDPNKVCKVCGGGVYTQNYDNLPRLCAGPACSGWEEDSQ